MSRKFFGGAFMRFEFVVRVLGWVVACAFLLPVSALAQQAWVQIEARPTEAQAAERARDWASQLADVEGYRLRSGWHAILIGPFLPLRAEAELARLRAARQIPNDAFVADGSQFIERFWPAPGAAPVEQTNAAPPPPPEAPEETVAQSRRAERGLTRDEREEVQRALAWRGVYTSGIDGDFGPGTRRAMADWQRQNGFEATGVMSTMQRSVLIQNYRAAVASLGFRTTIDRDAGIEISLPAELVRFSRYVAPFAYYDATQGGPAQVLLISQEGDRDTLASLYEVLQTLEIVPRNGPRRLNRTSFSITGVGQTIVSESYAALEGGEIKGFIVVWPAADSARFPLVAQELAATFRPIPGSVLPPEAGRGNQDPDLVAGLAIRRPIRSRSGFFVDQSGIVATATEALDGCGRVELGDGTQLQELARNSALGLALLRPQSAVAPLAVGRLTTFAPELRSQVAVAGYSYEGLLGAPTLTYGALADVRGLDGNPALQRLEMAPLPGDVGGPVLDARGRVSGLLIPPPSGDRALPEGVAFAVGFEALGQILSENGLASPVAETEDPPLAPEDLAARAADMTVLVSCWAD
jgi:peptidoglycan hydrolase-like protein with peptidoglycan-binding domain